ncbi:Uncharacterised protein [Mycobacterium tuberculosis]|nr:Uncharacterised protein [Mycobacterium tuberculosis]
MQIVRVAAKTRRGFVEPILREQRHAVECLLAVGDDVVAKRLDRLARESLIDALDFLQADNVRRPLLEPCQQMIQPLADRVNVPGGNPHVSSVSHVSDI